jgi:Uma2 family endonuclease
VTPSPRFNHQAISGRIHAAFIRYLDLHPVGEIAYAPLDVIFSDYDVLEPDLLFVLNERRSILQDWVRGAPDLVIEILSPTTTTLDRGPKLKAYARFGVSEYWIVDPEERAITVYRMRKKRYQLADVFREAQPLTSSLLPGFSLSVGSVFNP